MANRSDIQAGKAHVTLYVQASQLVKGLQAANQKLMAFGMGAVKVGAAVAAAGAAAMGAFGAAVGEFVETGDALAKMAQRTGLSVEALSELGYAAQQSGTDMATLEKAIRAMQKKTGGNGQSPEAQFLAMAESIAEIQDPSRRAQRALEVFGKSGADLLPMLAEGRQGIEALRREAERLGARKSGESAEMAVKLGDAIDRAFTAAKSAIYDVGAALAPVLLPLVDSITEIVAGMAKWVKQNGDLVRAAAAAAASVAWTGLAIMGLGAAIVAVTSAVAFAMTPLGAWALGLAAAGAAAWKLVGRTEFVQSALAEVGEQFAELAGITRTSWKAIVGAVMAGDLQAALDVAVAAANVAWLKIVELFQAAWQPVKGWFLSTWQVVSNGLAEVMMAAWYGIERAFVEVVAGMKSMWREAVMGMALLLFDTVAQVAEIPGIGLTGAGAGAKAMAAKTRKVIGKGAAVAAKDDAQALSDRLAEIDAAQAGAANTLGQMNDEAMRRIMESEQSALAGSSEASRKAMDEFNEAVGRANQAIEAAGLADRGQKQQAGEQEQRIQSAAVATTAAALVALGGAKTPEQLQREANKKLGDLVEINAAMLKQQRAAQLQFVA